MKTVNLMVICFAATFPATPASTAEMTNLFRTVRAQIYEGQINSESSGMSVHAEWRIEWPESFSSASSKGLAVIQRQMIDDCFGSLVMGRCGWEDRSVSQVFTTPDKALQVVFSRAYEKLDVPPEDDSLTMRAFDFGANLTIRFAASGYVGYVLEGYENEGGNGCHSYVIARVLSLATGLEVTETDFMTQKGLASFPKAFYDLIIRKGDVRECLIGTEDDTKAALGNFVFEPEGIRWWLPPYSLFAGAAGVQDMLMTWKDLKPYLKSGKERDFKAIFAQN